MYTRLSNLFQFFILFILCVIFVCLKVPNLNIPYYWDEAWVYAPAIKAMAHNGLGLLPNSLSDSYSRGHPLLFFFIGAIWVKVFGESIISMHIFALVIAVSFVFALYYIVKKIFDPTLALIVAAITLVQPIFIAQSAIVLPEIFLSLWAILTVYHFITKNSFYYFLFGTLMILTKESGSIVIAALMIYLTICFLSNKVSFLSLKIYIKDLAVVFVPILPFIIFLLIQHYQRGYYFFPEHIALLNFNWHDFQEALKRCYDYMFEHQGRLFITWSFLLAFVFLYKQIPVFIKLVIVFGLITCVKVFFRYWPLPDWLMIIFIVLFTCAFYYCMHIKYADNSKLSAKILAIIFITGIIYFLFSSVNFFSNRYLFLLVPLMILYFSYYVQKAIEFRFLLPYCWALIISSVMIYNAIAYCKDMGDDSPQYVDAIKLEQMMTSYMEQQQLQKQNIFCVFNMKIALENINHGYLSGNENFSSVSNVLDKNTQYIIYTNIDLNPLWLSGSDTLPNFQLLKKFNYGVAYGKVFKRIL